MEIYNQKNVSSVKALNKTIKENESYILSQDRTPFLNIAKIFDLQCRLASFYLPFCKPNLIGYKKNLRSLNAILFSCFHKNLISLFSSYKLSLEGLYGPARPILRNVYEYLMIAKFSNVSGSLKVLNKWYNHQPIFLTNMVISHR